jgi:hypothetical protein
VSVPAAIRSCRLFTDSVSSENGSVGAVPTMSISFTKRGLQPPRDANGGAGRVAEQR